MKSLSRQISQSTKSQIKMEDRHCAACANWFPGSGDASTGECRRHAPYPRGVDERENSPQVAWPQTLAGDGCGEWYFGGQRRVEPSGHHIGTGIDTKSPAAGERRLGAFGWGELRTDNPKGAKAFYGSLFGWEVRDEDSSTGAYSVIGLDGRPIGGIVAVPQDASDRKAHWGAYVSVRDVDALVARARDLGGRVLVATQEIPGIGRFAVLEDPQGAALGVISFLEQSP
jgi:predicted enzyme related to lactoylglutathione lyase